MHLSRRRLLRRLGRLGCSGLLPAALAGAAGLSRAADPAAAPSGTVIGSVAGTVFRLASVEEGRRIVSTEDDWLRATGIRQGALLMGRKLAGPAVPLAEFAAFQASAVRAWDETGRQRWAAALQRIAPALQRLQLPLPREVLMLRTDGRESAQQPHTRANAIVWPDRFEQQGFGDAEVLAHELWHVASRHDPALASRLYALIGYEPARELQWPPGWIPNRLANQDAPRCDHVMRLRIGGRATAVMPVVVVADDVAPGMTLLDAMEPRLLEVTPGRDGQQTRPVMRGHDPVWHPIEAVPEFEQRLGGNTDYTQHPDETIADNLMFLVVGRKVRNEALLRALERELLSAARSRAPR